MNIESAKSSGRGAESLEQVMGKQLKSLCEGAEESFREGEAYVRREPAKSIAWAVGAGYLLRILPLGAIISAVLGLLVAALRPVILLFAVAKAFSLLGKCSSESRDSITL